MKIAIYGNFSIDYCSEVHYAKTLRSMGHEVVELQEPRVSAQKLVEVANSSDMFVWIHTHGWNTPNMLDALKAIKVPTVAYHLDLYMGLQRWKEYEYSEYIHVDHFFTVDKLMADWLNENTNTKGHYLLPAVYDQEAYATEHIDSRYVGKQVMFVGSKGYHPEWPYRPRLIDWLRQTYGDKFLHVGGDGDTGTVRGHKLNLIYNTVPIAIGDTLNIDFDYPYYTSDRLFESIGRGGFTIYPRIKGVEDILKDKEEVAWYQHGNLNDLKNKIEYYLNNPEEREQIRRAGHAKVKAEHTYKNRWQSIIDEVTR